ncbi:MAG: MraY family glycosyltransferase [Gammaproteobacteria bacterium]|nr:MraY family glycosyltransferase [Gammaproteobacteria bacterium]
MTAILVGFGAALLAALTIRLSMPFAARWGLVDRPGGHKGHRDPVPLVGGVGIFAAVALLSIGFLAGTWHATLASMLAGASMLFVLGIVDDRRGLGVLVRFAVQGAAVVVVALGGGIVLHDLGALVSTDTLVLGAWALPFTVFAVAGVINALNMSDGVDGLSGALTVVTLLNLSVVAVAGAAPLYFLVGIALLGAVAGFLVFNLRCCGRPRALVFMGDAGSTVIGFVLSCLLIGLSQGDAGAMSPVIALWLFALPLYDTVATIVRRAWLRSSPFAPDRDHLHHLLLSSGLSVPQCVSLIVGLHALFGIVGLIAWQLQVADRYLFAAFLTVFAGYLFLVSRPWRFVPLVGRALAGRGAATAGTGRSVSRGPTGSAAQAMPSGRGGPGRVCASSRTVIVREQGAYGVVLPVVRDDSGIDADRPRLGRRRGA